MQEHEYKKVWDNHSRPPRFFNEKALSDNYMKRFIFRAFKCRVIREIESSNVFSAPFVPSAVCQTSNCISFRYVYIYIYINLLSVCHVLTHISKFIWYTIIYICRQEDTCRQVKHTHTHTHTHNIYIYIYIYIYIHQSQVASYQRLSKWYLISPCLTLNNIRYVSRVKWSNSGKGVAPSPTHRCISYWKGSLLVVLDYGRQLYLYNSQGFEEKSVFQSNSPSMNSDFFFSNRLPN